MGPIKKESPRSPQSNPDLQEGGSLQNPGIDFCYKIFFWIFLISLRGLFYEAINLSSNSH